MKENLLTVKNLESWYEKDNNILNRCDFSIDQNEILALVGSNGSGKTTLIKTLTDIHPKFSAERIEFKDRPIDFSDGDFKLSRIAVFSEDNSFKYWSFDEYNNFLHKVYNKDHDESFEKYLIDNFNFTPYIKTPVKELSMGNKKKFFTIAAFSLKLPFLILDEPVDGLDFESAEFLYDLVHDYKEYGSILMSTHILESITRSCDTYILLDKGKLSHKAIVDHNLSPDKILRTFEESLWPRYF